MSQNTDIAYANFFFRDYVTEDIVSYCIGDVYLYNYKETLIGVRDVSANLGFFADVASVPKNNSPYAPTLEMMTEKHVKEAMDDIDRAQEKTETVPIIELVPKALELLSALMSKTLDKLILGE